MEPIDLLSRRDFLIKGAGALGAANLALWAGGCESCVQQIQNRPTRKNIQTLWAANPSDPIITTYKAAVTAMKALDTSHPTDPRGWQHQANIHFNSCLHRNWLWLPWHRVYLLYFERICRKLTGDDSFALPYWNWNSHPAVPDPFWDTSSSLYDPNRAVTQTDKADASYIGTTVLQNILGETNFELFASLKPQAGQNLHLPPPPDSPTEGMLESQPHDNIHIFVGCPGGDMCGFHSPLDPVFYTHHCMLDCLWAHWNIDLGNANTNDSDWTNYSITDFFDENGNPVTVAVATTVLFPILSYQYEPCSIGTTQGSQKRLQGKQLEQFLRTGAPSKLEFVQRFELRQEVAAAVGKPATVAVKVEPGALRSALEADVRTRLVLTVAEVEVPERRDFFVRVFLNKPDASGETPIDDPHYAGSFAFFFDESAMKNHQGATEMPGRPKTGFLVDVRPTLTRLSQGGSLSLGEVAVSFVPVPSSPRAAPSAQVKLGRLELAVARF